MTLKTGLFIVCAVGLAACTPQPMPMKINEAAAKAKSAEIADRYQKELLTELQTAMKSGGPTAAIDVCHEASPAIAQKLSEESGASVRRTALKVRNPNAAPSPVEIEHLKSMQAAPLGPDGKPVAILWVDGEGEAKRVHYMRAIPLKPECQTCHGVDIAPEVQAAIKAKYPNDQATGFKPGELRGAFSIDWPAKMFVKSAKE